MGNLLHFFITLFYFFMLFPWIPRTLIDGLILSSNTSVENWKWFIWHTSWLSSDLISKEICDCETKKEAKKRQKTHSKRRIRLICIEITNVRWTPFDSLFFFMSHSKPSLKIRTASAIFWNYLGIFRDNGLKYNFFLEIKLFCFSR